MPALTLSRRKALGLLYATAAPIPKPKFLWGAATAGHHVKSNLVNDDCWLLEHLPNSIFKEPSGDACDQYHLLGSDIALLAGDAPPSTQSPSRR